MVHLAHHLNYLLIHLLRLSISNLHKVRIVNLLIKNHIFYIIKFLLVRVMPIYCVNFGSGWSALKIVKSNLIYLPKYQSSTDILRYVSLFMFLLIFLVSLIAPKFFSITEQLQQIPQEPKKFRSILNDSILDHSPFVKLYLPYFETEKGKMSLLRSHFPAQPYWSPLLTGIHHFLLLDLFFYFA